MMGILHMMIHLLHQLGGVCFRFSCVDTKADVVAKERKYKSKVKQ